MIMAFSVFALIALTFLWWKKSSKSHALHDAAAAGNIETIDKLVDSGFSVDALYDNMTALHVAVIKNKLESAEMLISLNASVNLETCDETCVTSLHLAAMIGNPDMADLLIRHGADMTAHAANGETPLLTAARYGHKETVDVLVSQGADLQATNAQGNSLLFMCIFSNDTKAATLLLDAGMNPNVQDKDRRAYALHAAMIYAIHSGNYDMVDCLLSHGADPNVRDQHNMTPLKMAKIDKQEELIELLASYGAQA